jgi:hypothetical protein
MTVLLRNGRVHGSDATAVAWDGPAITYVGTDAGAPAADEVVDLGGALVTPGFTDHHVHTVRTGFARTGLDLAGASSLAAALHALAGHAAERDGDGVLVGQGWDETDWPEQRHPTGDELEAAAPGRRTYLTRVDGHSSVISPALAALVPGLAGLAGWSDDGRVERDAHHAVRAVLEGLIGPEERHAAALEACRAMAAHGITSFHENAAPHIGPEHEIELVRAAADQVGLRCTVYWGELLAVETGRRLGVAGLAGDLVADGAFGSRTAALTSPYADRPGSCGHAYVTAEQVHAHVVACTEAGLQAGFHAIGDAALENVHRGLVAAERDLGAADLRAAEHRVEHVEMPSPAMMETMARLGVVASVQPMFDALWGGPRGMYAERLGERWRVTNPLRSLHDAGVRLAFGSDSPVTRLGAWDAVDAAVHHHAEEQRLPAEVAFAAHTGGATLAPGQPADLVVWRADRTAGRTVVSGRTIHRTEEAA